MKEKIRLLFDANILSYDYQKTGARSGIFFVAYNLLKELTKYDNIEIGFYVKPSNILGIHKFVETNSEFSNIPIICKTTFITYFLGLLEQWKYSCRKLDKKDNFFKKFVRFFAIRILNFSMQYNFVSKINEKELSKWNIYFSPNQAPPKQILTSDNIHRFVLLHDAIPLALEDYFFNMKIKNTWFRQLYDTLNGNDYYFANSEYTKQDFMKYCDKLNPKHITTTLLGANENFYPVTDCELIDKIKTKYNIPKDKKFVFSLCTIEPRKNLIFAVKNFVKFIDDNNIDDLVFVMGGGHWQTFLDLLDKELSGTKDYEDKIIKTGYVDDEDLAALYSASEMFIYPSVYEGFGMPVLEAMQCGCACITSNVTSIPEVIGDAGIQVDPKSDEEMIEAYKKMYYDKNFQHQCREKALERSKTFSWGKCTNIIVDTIKKVVSEDM